MRVNIPDIKRMVTRGQPESRGITGLETAIVLIAFVVVSSVFAFAALSTGLFSADKSKETIRAGLSESRGTLELRGSVISKATTTGGSGIVDELTFQVANAAVGEPVNLTPGETIIKYADESQTHLADTTAEFTVTPIGNADSDNLVEEGEVIEITLLLLRANLSPDLQTGDLFSLEVIPPQGAVLFLERRTPVFLETYNDLN